MDLDVARALTSDEGARLLASLPPYDEKQAVTLTGKLREAGHSPELVAAVLTQSRLRTRARTKFGAAAATMLFTPDALEQATRPAVAQRHAERFRAAGITTVVDGGCGIGADAVGFAREGLDVVAVEADPATAELARHNLAFAPASRVETGLLEEVAHTLAPKLDGHTAWWFDPARRVSGVADITGRTKRTFDLAALSPSWPLVQQLADTTSAAGAKLSPGLGHADIPRGCEAEFTSFAGDVVEAALWWGSAARHEGPTATILKPSSSSDDAKVEACHVTAADAEGFLDEPARRADLGSYLYEADKALTRSGLVGALGTAVDGRELARGYGYVTSDTLSDVGLLGRRYRILDAVPLHTKTLRAYLRERNVGRLTVKKRDVDIDADRLRRDLKLKGTTTLTVVLSQLDGSRVALVVEPV